MNNNVSNIKSPKQQLLQLLTMASLAVVAASAGCSTTTPSAPPPPAPVVPAPAVVLSDPNATPAQKQVATLRAQMAQAQAVQLKLEQQRRQAGGQTPPH